MKTQYAILGLAALSVAALVAPTHVRAQSDGALLDALVKKGVLSDQEAEGIRADEGRDNALTPAGKLQLNDNVKSITFYGDARLRYEYLDETPQQPGYNGGTPLGHNASTTNRSRYRLRFGFDYTFSDHFSGGFELESSTANDSANQSFGSEYAKFGINVGLIYLKWQPTDWLTLVGGKQHNPFYTTDLVWDPDINPEGGSEALLFHPIDNLSIGFTGGQFIYADNNDYNNTFTSPTANKTDIWMFEEQVPVQFNWNKDLWAKVAPGFISYMSGGNNNTGAPGISNGGGAVNFDSPRATRDLQIFTAPGEVDWKVGDLPMRAYWDFALNTQGKERVQQVYLGNGGGPGTVVAPQVQNENRALEDNIAWLAGVQVGQNKKRGDWSVRGDFRQVGLGSIDPNLNDSDFGDSYLNQQGVRVQSIYNFTDFLQGSVTLFDTWALKDSLLNGAGGQTAAAVPLGGNGVGGATVTGTSAETASLVGAHHTQRVQIDLLWKF